MGTFRKKTHRVHVRVGIMDSDAKTASKLTSQLKKNGYHVTGLENTEDLFSAVDNENIDILILDVDAWGMKGYELIPVIKRMDRLLPIIVTSADDSIEIAAKVREQGILFYTLKPIDIDELKLVLKNALSHNFMERERTRYSKKTRARDNGAGDLLDCAQTSTMLHLSRATVRRMARQGEIPGVKVGSKWVFMRPQLQEWLRLTAAGNQKNYGMLILESMDDGVAVVDRQLKVVSCNSAYLKSHDVPFESVIGERCYRVSRRSVVPCEETICPVRQSFKTKKPAKYMHINYDKKGNPHYCDVIALPLKGKDDDVSEVVEIIRDNTETYNTNKHLNWIMGFFANECRSTLGPAMMNISALADVELASSISPIKQRDMVLSSLCSLKLLHDMIRNYVLTYRGENKRIPCYTKTVDVLTDIIDPVVQEFRPVLLKRTMQIETENQNDQKVHCDPSLLRIAFGNLVNNAAKYGTPGTTIVVVVRSKKKSLEVSVLNEGCGIAPKRLDDVFERYIRFDELGMSGTGLGLHVVKMIAQLHGGTARAESGYVVDEKPILYKDFSSGERYQELDIRDLRKFARFVVIIPQDAFSREV
jgi:excisionase family DNA binding protein